MFESKYHKLLPRTQFIKRMAYSSIIGAGLIVVSLLAGVAGYVYFEKLSWVDAFASASMILSGMGPLGEMKTEAGKIFAGCYAIYSGFAIITIMGVIFAPLIHRILHRFHLEPGKDDSL